MTSLLRTSVLLREFAHNRRFERAVADPAASQAAVLRALLRRNEATAFGREHRFSSIRNVADFARRVPMRDYEGFRPYVERIVAGEDAVLTTDAVTMFTTTSGTTAEPKLIPVTDRWREQMASLTRLWMYRALDRHPRYLDHKVLLIVSPAVEGHTATGVPLGSLSGVTYQRIPWAVRRSYAVPYAVTLVKDPATRYFLIMRLGLARSVSALATPNPTSLLRLADTAAARSEEIIRAIHDGALGVGDEVLDTGGADDLVALRTALRPDPQRARSLERVVAEHGVLLPGACWPDLRLIGCWLGGSAGRHAERLRSPFGAHATLRDLGFLASEGRMTVPVADGTAAGPLAVHANFYEFVPEDDIDTPSPPVLGAHELEPGQRYYLLLTGGNGLYRYDINDIVEVVGSFRRTPEVAFVRKGREMVSITGEKLHVNHIHAAVGAAGTETGLTVHELRLIPDDEELRHDLLVEFRDAHLDTSALPGFLASVDRHLQAENQEYRAKRTSGRLPAPRLFVMRPGWSEAMCRADFERGRRELQHKWRTVGLPWDEESRAAVTIQVDLPT